MVAAPIRILEDSPSLLQNCLIIKPEYSFQQSKLSILDIWITRPHCINSAESKTEEHQHFADRFSVTIELQDSTICAT
jgi:hypothetical protein